MYWGKITARRAAIFFGKLRIEENRRPQGGEIFWKIEGIEEIFGKLRDWAAGGYWGSPEKKNYNYTKVDTIKPNYFAISKDFLLQPFTKMEISGGEGERGEGILFYAHQRKGGFAQKYHWKSESRLIFLYRPSHVQILW